MNKLYRIKSSNGMIAVALTQIQAVRALFDPSPDTDAIAVEVIMHGPSVIDATMSAAELEALTKAWDEAL